MTASPQEDWKRESSQLAIRFLEEAVARRPSDATHVAYLAIGYHAMEDEPKARLWANRALKLDELNPHQERDLANLKVRIPGLPTDVQAQSVEQMLLEIRSE